MSVLVSRVRCSSHVVLLLLVLTLVLRHGVGKLNGVWVWEWKIEGQYNVSLSAIAGDPCNQKGEGLTSYTNVHTSAHKFPPLNPLTLVAS